MSLARFITFLGFGACLLWLQACSPVSITPFQAELQSQMAQIALPKPGSRLEQLVVQELKQNIIDRTAPKNYSLKISISEGGASTVAVRGTSSTLRTTKTKLTFTLTENETGETVLTDSLSASASSGSVSGRYAQEQSVQFSNERLAKLLANRLINRVALYIANTNTEDRP